MGEGMVRSWRRDELMGEWMKGYREGDGGMGEGKEGGMKGCKKGDGKMKIRKHGGVKR